MRHLGTFVFVATLLVGIAECIARLWPTPQPEELVYIEPVEEIKQQSWYTDWTEDHNQLRRVFQAYEIYGVSPFQGKYIRVNEEGRRFTHGETLPDRQTTHQIRIFGGSTLWGAWTRDEYTAPSVLAKALIKDKLTSGVRVFNHSDTGHVFSQEIHRSVKLKYLQKTNVPEVTLFFGGVNDSMAALSNFTQGIDKPAGLPWEYSKYGYLFQIGKTGEVSWSDVLKKFKCIRLALAWSAEMGWTPPSDKNIFRRPNTDQMNQLAKEVAAQYIQMVEAAHEILHRPKHKILFALQPIMAYKKHLTKGEKKVLEKNLVWQPYLKAVYQNIRSLSAQLPRDIQFIDWSRLFESHSTPLFSDVIHYSEAGNAVVGEAMAETLKPLLQTTESKDLS